MFILNPYGVYELKFVRGLYSTPALFILYTSVGVYGTRLSSVVSVGITKVRFPFATLTLPEPATPALCDVVVQ